MLIVCDGNVVHNLRRLDPRPPDCGTDWAQRFDTDVRTIMSERPAELTELTRHPDFALAVPTPDHFLPLAYLAGVADADRQRRGSGAEVLIAGYQIGRQHAEMHHPVQRLHPCKGSGPIVEGQESGRCRAAVESSRFGGSI